MRHAVPNEGTDEDADCCADEGADGEPDVRSHSDPHSCADEVPDHTAHGVPVCLPDELPHFGA